MPTYEENELLTLMDADPAAQALALGAPVDDLAAHCALRTLQPWAQERYTGGEMGNGYLFADFYRARARFVQGRRRWYLYDGRVWRPDVDGTQAMELGRRLVQHMLRLAPTVEDSAQREVFMRRAVSLQGRVAREKMLRDAAGVHPLTMQDFDQDPMLFNCQNGTLDLTTLAFHPHRADDLLTCLAGVRYDPRAACPRWQEFIRQITAPALPPQQLSMDQADDGWAHKQRYLQKVLGYALTGLTQYECLFLLYGQSTRNGKGTAMETILHLMGDYARTARPETVGARPNGSAPSEDIARLSSARFVNMSEPERTLTLAAGLVKSLTGNDTINARYLHENSFDYRPQFKIFINTNHLPRVNDHTLFTSGRIKTIPFERHFAPHEQDRTLKWQFTQPDALSGILNWCLTGLQMLQAEGLPDPDFVREANAQYALRADTVTLFVRECLTPCQGAKIKSAQVYAAYRRWCDANGYDPLNVVEFREDAGRFLSFGRARVEKSKATTNVLHDYQLKDTEE